MSSPHLPAGRTIRKAVIPAAGLGTRLRPLTNAFPKELLPIGRKPVLAHIAAEITGAGITEALFIVSVQKPQIRDYFGEVYAGDGSFHELRCSYVTQECQRGLGDALLCAEEWVGGEPFAVAFGDCLMDGPDPSAPITRMIETHCNCGASATVLAEAVDADQVFRYGVLAPADAEEREFDKAFRVRSLIEKPSPEEAPSDLVVAARWALEPVIFDYLRSVRVDPRGELNLTDAVRNMTDDGHTFWAAPLLTGERRRDIGNFETFFTSFVRAALRDSEFGESVRRAALDELAAERAHAR